jgi:dTDP-4-amino-4,6-dideoxygalactose transaminase
VQVVEPGNSVANGEEVAGESMSEIEHIAKIAQKRAGFHRSAFGFHSARDAFRSLLFASGVTNRDSILLPSFIGWSAREGSGVYDPVASIGAKAIFYRMNENLFIDVDDAKRKIIELRPRVLVLIHYFGYPDPNSEELAAFGRKLGVIVLEDEAHAMLSDLVGGVCGRAGDSAIFSLHKILPFPDGGVLLLNTSASDSVRIKLAEDDRHRELLSFWEYDLHRIAAIRRRNTEQLIAALSELEGRVSLLFPSLPPGVVPQTLPVVIQEKNRDELYLEMNSAGFGVVTLYHTLIGDIGAQEFPESHLLASRIMNLPVHQDVQPQQLEAMVHKLRELA